MNLLPSVLFIVGVILATSGAIVDTHIATTNLNTFWGNDASWIATTTVVFGGVLAWFSFEEMRKRQERTHPTK